MRGIIEGVYQAVATLVLGLARRSSAGSATPRTREALLGLGFLLDLTEEMQRDLAALAAGPPTLPSFGIAGDIRLAPGGRRGVRGRAPAGVRRGARALRRRRGPRLPARARLLPEDLSREPLRRDLQ